MGYKFVSNLKGVIIGYRSNGNKVQKIKQTTTLQLVTPESMKTKHPAPDAIVGNRLIENSLRQELVSYPLFFNYLIW